jgi:hypothetical protein
MELKLVLKAGLCGSQREPYDPKGAAELLRLASSVMTFYETQPGHARVFAPSGGNENAYEIAAR